MTNVLVAALLFTLTFWNTNNESVSRTEPKIGIGQFRNKSLVIFEFLPEWKILRMVAGDGSGDLEVIEITSDTREVSHFIYLLDDEGRIQGLLTPGPFEWEKVAFEKCPFEKILTSKKDLEGVLLVSDRCESLVSEKILR